MMSPEPSYNNKWNYYAKYEHHPLKICIEYIVHERVQLDIYAAIKAQNPAAESHVGLGIAWLIN